MKSIQSKKGFTILELLVVVAIIAILSVIALPNFLGKIEQSKVSQKLAEINAVTKAVNTYYADKGVYPTLQGKDGTLLQPQPIFGSPHNVDFSSLVPDYLATLPQFSYWWVDYQGKVYHTQNTVGSVSSSLFTPTTGYTYTLYKTNGTTQVLSGTYTLLAGEYIVGKDANNVLFPEISSVFKNEKVHPESGETPVVTFTTATFTNAGASGVNGPTQGQLDTAYTSTTLAGKVISSSGIQLWTVPATGTYRIITYGASGGASTGYTTKYPGSGAVMQGDFSLSAGTVLKILVGHLGSSGVYGGGGGGGTYVTKADNSPLIISGGGGGSASSNEGLVYSDASIGQSGKSASSVMGEYRAGGGGGGLTGSGASGYGVGGKAFTAGGAGGAGYHNGGNPQYSGSGGFGGGGGSEWYQWGSSGGGGGYSGGNGGANGGGGLTGYTKSGGGGSYNAGTNEANTVGHVGMGKVIVTYVGP